VTWLRSRLHDCDSDGIITVHLHLPADQPLPEDLDEKLFEEELFYSGLTMKTLQKWELVYTLLQGQHFDFDAVQLYEESAQELKAYMAAQYMKIKES